jgi:hypothetical protein
MALWAGGLLLVATLIIGGVIDFISLVTQKQEVQAAADASALAAARELQVGARDADRLASVALVVAKANLDHTPGIAVDTELLEDRTSVRVSITAPPRVYFPGVIGMTATAVRAEAVAQISGSPVCMIGLEVKAKRTLDMQKRAAITARNCAIYSNSTSPESIVVAGEAAVIADFICSAGGVKLDKKMALDPAPLTDCPVMSDPLASRPPPSVGACDYTKLKVPKGVIQTLKPGVYCGGIEIEGIARADPGVFIIKSGLLNVDKGGTLEGEHVGFFLTGKDALIDFEKDSTIKLSGPKTGPLAGLLFYEDRGVEAADAGDDVELDAVTNLPKPKEHRIRSDDARELVGTIYIPRNRLLIDGDRPIASESAYTVIIAREFALAEGPEIILNADYDSTDVPVPQGVGPNSRKAAKLVR